MSALLFIPLALQGLVIFIDEFYFHFKRGLPLWERVGHPVDTLSVFTCYLIVLFLTPTTPHLLLYAALSIFSSLLVTKDEFVHHRLCSGGEQWLHSLLFILHPTAFVAAGFLWTKQTYVAGLELQAAFIGLFGLYQIIYWNFLWKKTSA